MLSCSGQQKVERCPGDKHLFKVELSDSNYFFEQMENFLIPMKYGFPHFDLQSKMMNPTFTYTLNGTEVEEKVQVTFEHHQPDFCGGGTCWHKTLIKRPNNHKKVKDSYKNPRLQWPKCTFSFELTDIENIEFFHTGFLSGDYDREISVFVNSSHQDNN
jgi:hypothetical protein